MSEWTDADVEADIEGLLPKREVDLGAYAAWVTLGCDGPEQYAVCEDVARAVLAAVVPIRDARVAADLSHLRSAVEALADEWSACWCTVDGGGAQVQQRDCPRHGSDDCVHMAEGIVTRLRALLTEGRDRAGEGAGS